MITLELYFALQSINNAQLDGYKYYMDELHSHGEMYKNNTTMTTTFYQEEPRPKSDSQILFIMRLVKSSF